MYTLPMRKSPDTTRWWDWSAIAILFILIQIVASRLVTTDWTSFLNLTQNIAFIGFTVGVSLGYTRFSRRLSRWLSFLYMLVFLPLQWTLVIDQDTTLEEQFLSVGGRLFYSYSDFFARRPVEDPFFFITVVTLVFWILSASAGFYLVRNQNYLVVVLPSAVGLLLIQRYDNLTEGRIWFIAFFAFTALLLLGRLNFLANKTSWRERRVFLSPDNSIDLSSSMAIAAGLLIVLAWIPPTTISSYDSFAHSWNRVTRPWREFTQRMENAITALEGRSRGIAGEFYGPELALGSGFIYADTVMFKVRAPELVSDLKPPRYYWRGRTYDYYENGQWYTTETVLEDYSPENSAPPANLPEFESARFVFSTGDEIFSLIYAPATPIWISRQGSRLNYPVDGGGEVISWFAFPSLQSGEAYQVEAVLSNPNTTQLREASLRYPEWISNRYLQLPEEFPSRISEFALEITADAETPYDKAVVITKYLRDNIEYTDTMPNMPRDRDPVEWMLFESKQGYCVYYSSAEILMLRSLGIPARLAVGFAQGERSEENEEYTIRKENAHAWPEVYFPGIGWVEFEPTGNQLALNRPVPPDPETQPNVGDTNRFGENDIGIDRPDRFQDLNEEDVVVEPQATRTVNPALYLTPLFIAFVALTVFLSRRYSVPARIPVLLRNSFERNNSQVPAWILNWERWMSITPIERSFESVNFSLRLLDKPMPVDATPIERVTKLMPILPRAENDLRALLDEHQTSLYTSRVADASLARRAAFTIRMQALGEWVRYFFEGKPTQST